MSDTAWYVGASEDDESYLGPYHLMDDALAAAGREFDDFDLTEVWLIRARAHPLCPVINVYWVLDYLFEHNEEVDLEGDLRRSVSIEGARDLQARLLAAMAGWIHDHQHKLNGCRGLYVLEEYRRPWADAVLAAMPYRRAS